MIQVSGGLRLPVVVRAGVCSAIQRGALCHPRNPHDLGRQAGARRVLESTSNGTQHTCAQAVEFQPENSTCDKLWGGKKINIQRISSRQVQFLPKGSTWEVCFGMSAAWLGMVLCKVRAGNFCAAVQIYPGNNGNDG